MIERVITNGIFSLDGSDFEVENNIWIVGDHEQVVIVDAAHNHQPIVDAVAGRSVAAIVATHGHNDHINAAVALADAVGAPILLHPDDLMLWREVYADREPDGALSEGQIIEVAATSLTVLHTPGHSPGGCCLFDAGAGVVFSGDTLFRGGPGATGRSYSDYSTIVASIRQRLFALPPSTRVLTGHGDETTVGDEMANLAE
jgi:glyoxylase-like metal-dependent hydrolase (beta-lactamase superfamily II)